MRFRLLGLGWALGALAATAQDPLLERWWERDLLDFSSPQAKVLVNPYLDLAVGSSRGAAVFENTRGAQFQATVDSVWEVQGRLEERQGAADPLLTLWAASTTDYAAGTLALPGWGRAKWSDRITYTAGDPIRFDASRAVVTLRRTGERWAWASGLDHQHEGEGRGSAYWGSQVAPVPYMEANYRRRNWHAGGWMAAAVGDERGPVGATAESLYQPERVTRIGGGFHQDSRLSMDLLWYHLATIPFTDSIRQTRDWGGAQASLNREPWHAYAAVAVDWQALAEQGVVQAHLGELLHVGWRRGPTHAWMEWQRSVPGSLSGSPQSGKSLPLTHSGTPLTHFWGDGVATLRAGITKKPMIRHDAMAVTCSIERHKNLWESTESDEEIRWNQVPVWAFVNRASWLLMPTWPLALTTDLLVIKLPNSPEPTFADRWRATWCIGLSHKIHP
jgi:hypothetical protein